MTESTPGPWIYQATAGGHDFSVYAEQGNGRDVALVREANEANARLIAAAPELKRLLVAIEYAADFGPNAVVRAVTARLADIRAVLAQTEEAL